MNATIEILEFTKCFVAANLSQKSADYILNSLFKNVDILKDKMPLFEADDKKNVFVLGQLDQTELEFYFIMESLSRRIVGTVERINGMYISDSEYDDSRRGLLDLLREREERLSDLQSDWKKTKNYLYGQIECRLKDKINNLFEEKPDLKRTRFRYGGYISFAGYDFLFSRPNIIMITNRYPMGGD